MENAPLIFCSKLNKVIPYNESIGPKTRHVNQTPPTGKLDKLTSLKENHPLLQQPHSPFSPAQQRALVGYGSFRNLGQIQAKPSTSCEPKVPNTGIDDYDDYDDYYDDYNALCVYEEETYERSVNDDTLVTYTYDFGRMSPHDLVQWTDYRYYLGSSNKWTKQSDAMREACGLKDFDAQLALDIARGLRGSSYTDEQVRMIKRSFGNCQEKSEFCAQLAIQKGWQDAYCLSFSGADHTFVVFNDPQRVFEAKDYWKLEHFVIRGDGERYVPNLSKMDLLKGITVVDPWEKRVFDLSQREDYEDFIKLNFENADQFASFMISKKGKPHEFLSIWQVPEKKAIIVDRDQAVPMGPLGSEGKSQSFSKNADNNPTGPISSTSPTQILKPATIEVAHRLIEDEMGSDIADAFMNYIMEQDFDDINIQDDIDWLKEPIEYDFRKNEDLVLFDEDLYEECKDFISEIDYIDKMKRVLKALKSSAID